MSDLRDGLLIGPDTIRVLLSHLEQSDVEEIELSWGTAYIHIRRDARSEIHDITGGGSGVSHPDATPITAPLTGVFYRRPSPEQVPFVDEGQAVERGQVVGLIETMKLFNEVLAEIDGTVVDIVVEEGDLVEENKPLMYIRPAEGVQE